MRRSRPHVVARSLRTLRQRWAVYRLNRAIARRRRAAEARSRSGTPENRADKPT